MTTKTKPLPHIAWAWLVLGVGLLLRVWALPFLVLGWLFGVAAMMFRSGCELADESPLLKWQSDLRDAYARRKQRPPVARADSSASGTFDDADEFDDDDDDFDDD